MKKELKKSRQIQGRIPSDGTIDPTVMPLYVRLENPYMATLDDKELVRSGQVTAEAFKDKLIAEGYDGAIMPVLDGNEIVVFDNKAVKSTINSGTWNTEIANIYKQQVQEILAQRFSIGSVHLKKEQYELQHEILIFGPRMGHDDTIDALAYACKYAHPPKSMQKNKSGDWLIINIIVNGVNLGLTFRNQFQALAKEHNENIDETIKHWTSDADLN